LIFCRTKRLVHNYKNRLCQYAIARRSGRLLYELTHVKRDSKIRAFRAVDDCTSCSHVRGSPFVCVFPTIRCSMLRGSNLATLAGSASHDKFFYIAANCCRRVLRMKRHLKLTVYGCKPTFIRDPAAGFQRYPLSFL